MDFDEKILRSLMTLEKARFNKLLRETQAKTGGISRQTFTTRLEKLVKDGVIKHEKKMYSLGASKLRINYNERSRLRLVKIEKEMEKLPYKKDMFLKAYDLLMYVFRYWYFPLIFDHVGKPDKGTAYDKLQNKIRRKKCEIIIQKIYLIMKKEKGNHKANDLMIWVEIAYERIPSKIKMF